MEPLSRRIVFQGLGALGVAAMLAGCGGTDGDVAPPSAGDVLTPTDDVPVGGGVVLADRQVIVTQPEAGTFVAFSAVCTHAGATITSIDGTSMICPQHGSEFDIATGRPTRGPATTALAELPVRVKGDDVVAA